MHQLTHYFTLLLWVDTDRVTSVCHGTIFYSITPSILLEKNTKRSWMPGRRENLLEKKQLCVQKSAAYQHEAGSSVPNVGCPEGGHISWQISFVCWVISTPRHLLQMMRSREGKRPFLSPALKSVSAHRSYCKVGLKVVQKETVVIFNRTYYFTYSVLIITHTCTRTLVAFLFIHVL